jgi:hypothetical protein
MQQLEALAWELIFTTKTLNIFELVLMNHGVFCFLLFKIKKSKKYFLTFFTNMPAFCLAQLFMY